MVAACCQTYHTVCQAKSMGGWDASWPQGPKGLPTLAPPSMLGSGVGRGLGGGSPPVAVGPAPSVALGVGIRRPPQHQHQHPHQHQHQHQRVHRIASLHPRRGERTGRTGLSSPGALMGAWGGIDDGVALGVGWRHLADEPCQASGAWSVHPVPSPVDGRWMACPGKSASVIL